MRISITGQVVDRRRSEAVAGLRVEAWSARHITEAPLAVGDTERDGIFRLTVDDPSERLGIADHAELFFRVFRADTLLASTERGPRWPQDGAIVRIDVDGAPDAIPAATVTGRVRRADDTAVEGAAVELTERTASRDIPLTRSATDAEGIYRFEVAIDSRDRDDRSWLLVRMPGRGAAVLAESDPFPLQSGDIVRDLVLGAGRGRSLPDFERDERAVALFAGGRPLPTLGDEDVMHIARDAGIERATVERLRKAARLAADTGLPARALYAMDAAGVPLDLPSLSRLEPKQIDKALRTAVSHGAVSAEVEEDAAALHDGVRKLRASTTSLADVARAAGIRVNSGVIRELAEKGTRTLEDLRRAGRAARPERCGAEEAKGLQQLEALSVLTLLPADLETHGRLLRAGYATHDAIAATPPDVFVRSLRDTVGEAEARALHTAAVVQLRALTNVSTLVRVEAAAGRAQHGQALQSAIPATCECEDCRSALSPMAYLADLIDYASRHITEQGNPIGRLGLEARFLQPFSGLPMTCETLSARVRQARIAIEVLRRVVPAAVAQSTPDAILEQAYFMLLQQLGTSFDELRDMRTRSEREQIEYLHRLGLHVARGESPAAVLDMLFREPGVPGPTAVTEDFLEGVFGLRDTRRDPLSAQPETVVLTLRIRRLRDDVWVEEDWPAQPAADARPLVDPDMLTPEDMTYSTLTLPSQRPRLATQPIHLWEDRRDEIANWTARIDDVNRELGRGVEALEAFITDRAWSARNNRWVTLDVGLGITTQDFEDYAARQAAGEDITTELQALRMDADAFAYVAAAWERVNRAQPVTLIASEWSTLRAILIQRLKVGRFATWRAQERALGLTLAPPHFRLRSAPLQGGLAWQSKDWRTSSAARQWWEDRLRARLEQQAALAEAVQTAVDAVERAILTYLRDALILLVVLPPGTRRAEWLTARYQLDFLADTCHVTTRIAQAIETLQGLLNGARLGLLEDPALALDAPDFDAEWQWIGSYASWSAAIQVFNHPEIALRPTLRRDKSEAFEDLLDALRASGRVTPDLTRSTARSYTAYFNDVCSLTPVSVYESQGWEGQNLTGAKTAPCIVIARARSGKLYSSGFRMRPAWYLSFVPDHTFWATIKGLSPAAEIAGLLPFQPTPGDVRLALYARTGGNGTASISFASYDGSSWTTAAPSDLPEVVTSVQYPPNAVIPSSAALRAAGVAGWRVDAGDRFIPMIVAGFGSANRSALLVFAANREGDGSRRIGIVGGREGGLGLTAFNTIDGGWSLPAGDPILLWSGGLQYLLVVRTAGPLTQLGLISAEWPGSGRPSVRWETADGFVYDAGNVNRWRVNAAAIRTAANLDDPFRSELIALEYEQTRDAWNVLDTSTRVTVLRMDGAALRLIARPLLKHPLTEYPGACKMVTHIRATHVVPVSVGAVDRLLFLGVDFRTSITREGACVGTLHAPILAWEARWESTTQTLETTGTVAQTAQPSPQLPLQQTDEFLPVPLPDGSTAVLLVPTSRDPIVVLKRNTYGNLAEVSRMTGAIDPARPGGDSWPLKAGDRFSVAGPHLLAVRADGSEVAMIDPTVAGPLQVRWMIRSRVRFPGLALEPEWMLRSGAKYGGMDIDGDAAVELVTVGPDGSLAILRTILPRGLTGDPLRNVGPFGVSVREIIDQRSPDWLADRAARIQDAYERNGASPSLLRYLDEAFHFIPMEFGMRLRESAFYTASLDWLRSVYDHSQPRAGRKISYKLVVDEHVGEDDEAALQRYEGWLLDPLNPHAIAELRPHSFTRHAQLAVARTLLDFADAEFSRATAESVPRARELYLEALEVLDSPEIRQDGAGCQSLIRELEIVIGEDEYRWLWNEIVSTMGTITDRNALSGVVAEMKRALATDEPLPDRLSTAQRIIANARAAQPESETLERMLTREGDARRGLHLAVLADPAVERLARKLVNSNVVREAQIELRPNPRWEYVPAPRLLFCVPPNPTVAAAVRHAELHLQKIRTCRNIAGVEMHLEPYALAGIATMGLGTDRLPSFRAPALQPSPYRYSVLVERARQLVDLARQIESSMLQSLQSLSHAEYEDLKARQDLALARAGVRLKDLQLLEAVDGITEAQLQSARAQFSTAHYRILLASGVSVLENAGLAAKAVAVSLQFAGIYSLDTLFEWAGAAAPAFAQLSDLATTGASYERRAEEWRFQRQLGEHDVRIAGQQIRLAQDRVRIAAQERALTGEQVDHAETMLEFIQTKRFGTAALYEWMSGVLEQVYRFFLQQATAIAQLAEAQLAFERQQVPPTVIRDDYWEPPSRTASGVAATGTASGGTETHGLTGSARLLRDLYELDQYAFRTNQRKLQLTETLSLAQLDPFVFHQFRTSGVLPFATPMSLFDRRFPGHYLRLIRSVRTSVIALVPPSYGIRAVLATTGTSRVVIGGDRFQVVAVQRGPESVALSAPMNATGLFELDVQPEMLVPFEGIGVDTTWEFRLPKASNPFDFSTIADVLVTIEYTALDSSDWRDAVIAQMDQRVSADRGFSMRHHFADAWYDLHNPDQVPPARRMIASFRTTRADFPPNIDGLVIRHVALYFIQNASQPAAPVDVLNLQFQQSAFGPARTDDQGIVSTRRGNGAGWNGLIGRSPVGDWEIALPDTAAMRRRFTEGAIDELLLAITYAGRVPAYPR